MQILIHKNEGETPLQCIERLKENHQEYLDNKMTYAGRLDPMAEGLLLILTDEDVHLKEQFLGLDKTYEVDILFGFSTDTYDILGIVNNTEDSNTIGNKISEGVLKQELGKYQKTFMQDYPAFSSKTVQGKPLWLYARENPNHPIPTPQKEVTIHEISLLKISEISRKEILDQIIQRIKKVSGDFRQDAILTNWNEQLGSISEADTFPIARIKVSCSSGTYMRTLANQIGKDFKIPALAWSIKRTELGNFNERSKNLLKF
jgi:tRNA pseudouridine55 synthase